MTNEFNPNEVLEALEAEIVSEESGVEVNEEAIEKLVAIEAELGILDDDSDTVYTTEEEVTDETLAELAALEEACAELLKESEDLDLDDVVDAAEEEGCVATEDDDEDEEDITLDDVDDLSPEELEALDSELRSIDVDADNEDDSEDEDEIDVADDEDEVSLTPDEELEADDMMKLAATSMLISDELNSDEKADFVKNEAATAIKEGFMTDEDVNMLAESVGLVTEAKYNSKQIIRLSAESKQKQLYALAVNVSAAAHKDTDFMKLRKIMKMRKILRAKLDKKYHAEATKRMRVYFRRLQSSKSPVVAKLAAKVEK